MAGVVMFTARQPPKYLLRWSTLRSTRLEFSLEVGQEIHRDFADLDGLSHAAEEPRQEALHRIGWVRRHGSVRLAASLPPKCSSRGKLGPLGCRKPIPCRTTSPEAIAQTTRPVSG
jgi:hypothetical protein